MTLPLMAAALVLDRLFGEPRRRHPLVGFGKLAGRIEARFNRPGASRGVGLLAWLTAVLPLSLSVWLLARLPYLGWLIELLVLYLAIGLRSLRDHAQAVSHALDAGDLSVARERVGFMVSRQTDQLDETGVALATTESVLENGSDAVFAALFWFVLLGGFGPCCTDWRILWMPCGVTAMHGSSALAGRQRGWTTCSTTYPRDWSR